MPRYYGIYIVKAGLFDLETYDQFDPEEGDADWPNAVHLYAEIILESYSSKNKCRFRKKKEIRISDTAGRLIYSCTRKHREHTIEFSWRIRRKPKLTESDRRLISKALKKIKKGDLIDHIAMCIPIRKYSIRVSKRTPDGTKFNFGGRFDMIVYYLENPSSHTQAKPKKTKTNQKNQKKRTIRETPN